MRGLFSQPSASSLSNEQQPANIHRNPISVTSQNYSELEASYVQGPISRKQV